MASLHQWRQTVFQNFERPVNWSYRQEPISQGRECINWQTIWKWATSRETNKIVPTLLAATEKSKVKTSQEESGYCEKDGACDP